MNISIQRFCLLTIGLLLCVLGCTRDSGHILMPDHISHATEVVESTDSETSFEQNVLPILTARCALAGCHVADGPHGLDFRTYESFIAGGEHGPAFIPGNAQESEVVEQIVSGRMPPGGPPLTTAEIQVFVDWINQQKPQDDIVPHDDHHEAEEDDHVDMDDAHDAEEDEHVDIDDEHDEHDMDIDHDDMEDEHDDMDDEHDDDAHDEDGHDEDDDDDHDNDDHDN